MNVVAKNEKDPAMLVYGVDFYADEAVVAMTLEQEAAYWRLLMHAHREGSIPADVGLLCAIVVKVPARRFPAVWAGIAVKWVPHPTLPGRLVNQRQEREREKRADMKRRMSEGGRRGNDTRWQKPSPPESGGDSGACDPPRIAIIPSIIPSSVNEGLIESASVREGAEAESEPGDAKLGEWLRDHGVLRLSPKKLGELVAKLVADAWTIADLEAVAAETKTAGSLAALLLDDARRTAFGDDLARRAAGGI